jgi:hypothetical protein
MSCSTFTSDKIIVFKDKGNNKCKMIFYNPNQITVTKTRVDDCVITNGCRCDFKLDCPNYEHYIEIKGKDIYHACEQIEETILQLSGDVKYKAKNSFIIATGAPNINGRLQIITKRFKIKYNSNLIIKTNKHTISI